MAAINMKISVSLLILSLGLAFGAGYIVLQVQQSEGHTFNFSQSEISELKRNFRENNSVVDELNATNLFSSQAGFELLNPWLVLSPGRRHRFSEVASVFRAEKFCKPNLITQTSLKKMKTWIAYQCGELSQLPTSFFDQSPFMSPLGISFASLAFRSKNEKFRSKDWIKDHVRFFHALELSALASDISLDSKRSIVSQLEANSLLSMTSGQSWIADENYIYVRHTAESTGEWQRALPTADYLVYPRKEWDKFLTRYRLETKINQTAGCAYQEEGLCWVKTSVSGRKIKWSLGLLFCLAIGIILFCVFQIIKIIRSQRLEEEKKRFALQALTHELRTPLASLVITSEHLLSQFESFPSTIKEPFLRMADDVQRLTRVAESSRNYLNAGDSQSVVTFDFVEIPSVNEFITSVLDRYAEDINIERLQRDGPFILDRYWIGICLQNLVQNAFQHGIKPITVRLKKSNNTLVVSVSDTGEISNSDKQKILKPFFKSHKSAGLGLGLTIVHTVVTAMNSKLKISSKPTNFELWIEGPK